MRLHVGAQNGVNACLVAPLLPEPFEQVSIKPHGDNLFAARQNNLGIFPEVFIRGVRVGIGDNARVNLGIAPTAQLVPICTVLSLRGLRCFASSNVFHGVLLATLR